MLLLHPDTPPSLRCPPQANLLARTQHADVVIATALRQLERHTAGCTPPRPGAHQSSSSKADPPNTISAEKFHIVDRLHARSGSLLDVDALRRRNDELARKLHDAVDAAHRLQEKVSERGWVRKCAINVCTQRGTGVGA